MDIAKRIPVAGSLEPETARHASLKRHEDIQKEPEIGKSSLGGYFSP